MLPNFLSVVNEGFRTNALDSLPLRFGLSLLLSTPCFAVSQIDDDHYLALKAEAVTAFEEGVTPFVENYCKRCHGNRRSKAGLNLEAALKLTKGASSHRQWKLAVAKVKAHDMPPIDGDKIPTEEERQQFIEWMGQFKYLSPKDPGPFVIRRLSKIEYGNTLQVLFGVDPSIADDLPEEVFGEGYLNSLSPMQSELFLGIANKVVDGLLTTDGEDSSELRKRLFGETPADASDFRISARTVAGSLARDAYRRPPSPSELDLLVRVFELGIDNGLEYRPALGLMLKAILVSPQFLFITPAREIESEEAIVHLDDHQLASRLSYLLWMAPPDESLSALADEGSLHKREILQAEVKRMLKHPRSRALFDGFGAQWLRVDRLNNLPFDPKLFPEMTDEMRSAMIEEARLFFESIVDENQSVVRFVDSDYTFLNETLAELYGLKRSVKGSQMRKVNLTDPRRGGILGMPGTLATSSHPNRTSPVKRGVWVLEQVLGEQVPPPPPDVPDLEEQSPQRVEDLTLRERTELHRNDIICATCHSALDPIGFGLENFDAIGRWRDRDDTGDPIDPSGKLLSGEAFDGPLELKRIIAGNEERLARNFAEKLMAYALGRQLEGYDEVVLDRLIEKTAEEKFKVQSIISEIVTSYPFTHRRIRDGKSEELTQVSL